MKISDLKIIHLLLAASIILWGWFFFRSEMTRYQMGFEPWTRQTEEWKKQTEEWKKQVAQAINQLDGRVKNLEMKEKK